MKTTEPPTITCLIIDDEPIAREGLQGYVDQIPFLKLVGIGKNALEANDLLAKESVDLIFLDIQMPQVSGLDFLKSLRHPPSVIFTTAYREYALDGFELDVLDYLVKPISLQRFMKAANKAQEFFKFQKQGGPKNSGDAPYFFIKTDRKYIKVYFEDILYVEGLKDYVFIHTPNEKHLVLISLKNVENQLPSDRFMRVHRSYIVALDKVQEMEGNLLKINSAEIPLSKNLRDVVYERLIGQKLWKR